MAKSELNLPSLKERKRERERVEIEIGFMVANFVVIAESS